LEASARRKIAGGKMLSVRLEHDGAVIVRAEVSGDFFMHPEEAIDIVEEALAGLPLSTASKDISILIDRVLKERGIVAIGFESPDLAGLIREALE
jgi:lipoate-protein ligase A